MRTNLKLTRLWKFDCVLFGFRIAAMLGTMNSYWFVSLEKSMEYNKTAIKYWNGWKANKYYYWTIFIYLFFEIVSDIQCSFATSSSTTVDMITARLKKPAGFKGSPLFADDRNAHPETDRACSIRPESSDPDNIAYTLKITDFSRCGVLKRNVKKRKYSQMK